MQEAETTVTICPATADTSTEQQTAMDEQDEGDSEPCYSYSYIPNRLTEAEETPKSCSACGCKCQFLVTSDKEVQATAQLSEHTYSKHPEQSSVTANRACQTAFTVYSTLTSSSFRFFTGLSKDVFDELVRSLEATADQNSFVLPFQDQVLLTLMRLRLGLLLNDLSFRFGISTALVSRIFCTIVSALAHFSRKYLVFWLARETIRRTMPSIFEDYPLATCIINCYEIFAEKPGNLLRRNQTYSHYKSHNTAKVLHVIAPNGFVMFISKPYGGRASDRFITLDSDFTRFLAPGDEILADRGFTIGDCLPMGVNLRLPSFSKGRQQISGPELVKSRRLARLRIHVERSIRRLKCFRILKYFPASIFAKKPLANDVLTAVAGLCNLQPHLMKDRVISAPSN
ncbi:uncharacterized protein LOC125943379 [Dermacentor silvarum]|uniref:uncharacterized protein LOC125943379 n=1 Tax=Dermacentor silvarum TaxID=543639 RepID=UPI002101B6B1|nr:uncharacterized protein LOC125943379 [Dermacentor silvarum]